MANQHWLEEVKRRLVENGLPPTYIRRFMDELADHFEDLMEEKMSKETNSLSQLGEPSQVADAAVIAYRQRTFFGRHPMAKFFVFGVSPIPVMLLTLCFIFCSLILIFEKFDVPSGVKNYLGNFDPSILNWGMSLVTLILPTMLLTILYCGWARRSDLGKKWILTSCSMLSIISMLLIYQVTISEIPGESTLCVGAGLGLWPTLLQWVQMLVPLTIGLWFIRRTRNQPTDKKDPLRAAV